VSRRVRDMETPEQQYARQQAGARADRARQAAQSPETPSHQTWRDMTPAQQGAWLARQDGNEDNAQKLEQWDEPRTPQPKKRWWQ
jgi:hypothetical protein